MRSAAGHVSGRNTNNLSDYHYQPRWHNSNSHTTQAPSYWKYQKSQGTNKITAWRRGRDEASSLEANDKGACLLGPCNTVGFSSLSFLLLPCGSAQILTMVSCAV